MRPYLTCLAAVVSIPVFSQQERAPEDHAPSASERLFTPHDIFRLQRVSEVAISPTGSHVAYTVNIERPFEEGAGSDYRELHVLNLATGESTAYITGKNFLSSVQWKPDGKQVTFVAKLGDAKSNTLYGINLSGGSWFEIASPSGMSSYQWRPDGKAIAYIANESTGAHSREERMSKLYERMGFNAEVLEENIVNKALFVYDLETKEAQQWSKSGSVFDYEWSPKGDRLAAQIAPRNLVDDSYMFKDIYIVNSLGQQMLVDVPGKLGHMAWSPDGKYLAFNAAVDINDPASGNLFAVDASSSITWSSVKNYTKDFEGTVTRVMWKDNTTMMFTSEESVDHTLREVKVGSSSSTLVIEGGKLVFGSMSYANGIIAFAGNTWKHSDDLFTYDLKKKTMKRHSELNPWLIEKEFGKQEKFAWKAKDGLALEGFLIYPVDYKPGTRYPLIAYVHGGPEAAVSNGWFTYYSTWGQVAASEGFFVFAPNYRSSTGRGVAFSKLGQKDLAAGEFTDILDGIDQLIADGKVDRNKVGIGGGSYGGYFAAWGATKHSDRFAAAVAFVGIANQISKRNTTDIPYEDYHVHWLIWTNENVDLMYDRSPVKWVANNNTPTLILHGKDDPRVHPSQSLELYRQLKMHGNAPVRLVWYPGEGHGNRNNPAQLDYAMRTMEWFTYFLKDSHPKGEMPSSTIDYGVGPERERSGRERTERMERPDRPDRAERPNRPDRMERPDRGTRPDGMSGTDRERDPERMQEREERMKQQQNQPQTKPGG